MRHPLTSALLLVLASCVHGQAGAPPCPLTLEGTVRVRGADPDTRVVLERGTERARIARGYEGRMAKVEGLTVTVCTSRTEHGELVPERFTVTHLGDDPVLDGTLERDGDRWVLMTRHGSTRLPESVPPALKRWEGQRVWVLVRDLTVEAWGGIG